MGTLLSIYFWGGVAFYIILWIRSSYLNALTDQKPNKWLARASIAFPLWPLFFVGIVGFILYKTFKHLIKLSEF